MLYHFNDFALDTDRRELRRGNVLVAVEPQVFDLLEFLIRARERVVSRDDLFAAVWQGRIVSEATLSSRVNSARAAIGDNGEEQLLIRTFPRKGFRFVGEVREESPPSSGPMMEAVLESVKPRMADPEGPSIAVLAFTNMSGDPEQDYFADGMAEDIITALSRCSGLFVIARNSSFTYKGQAVDIRRVGRELGVNYVLEGSVRRGGERLRISGQLIDAISGVHLWADRFDGDLTDVFELQDRITESVVAAIEPTLQYAEVERRKHSRPNKLDAYDLLLRAYRLEYEFTIESMTTALDYLDQALTIDPTYAPAMATAAYYHALRHFQGWPQDDTQRTKGVKLAWRAVELAPNDAQVLWMAAFAIWNMSEQRESARELFNRSLMTNPNCAMALTLGGWIETMRGNQATGRRMIERALRLSPREPRGWFMSGAMAIAAIIDQNYPEAVSWAEKALVQNRRFAVALRALAVALVQTGQRDRAEQVVQELLKIEPELTISGFLTRIPVPLETMARTYAEALRSAGLPE
ncbi:winged helix-turn-helix domain-containing tetratricopeptide repeat protein [Bradyrhizobium canariense]|uniref:winged helix-turn-helix domain-containing tetratricopeptide repeat protein n=1 Tax=Bradyrhizobium canariense TaxID=255045 RepID=UPI0011BA95D8|nr:winged helix-turn-helix domain-containing protein [Bradyrhizobium canariense]